MKNQKKLMLFSVAGLLTFQSAFTQEVSQINARIDSLEIVRKADAKTKSNTYLLSEPSHLATKIIFMPQKSHITILDYGNTFYKAIYNDKVGFIWEYYVQNDSTLEAFKKFRSNENKKKQVDNAPTVELPSAFHSDTFSTSDSFLAFTEAKGQPEYSPSNFEFSLFGYDYLISSNGQGRRSGGRSTPYEFNLRFVEDNELFRFYFAPYQNDILLILDMQTGHGSLGSIVRLNGKTLKSKWHRSIAGNIGEGLIEGDSVYLTGFSSIAKCKLKTGQYVWQHSDLYNEKDGSFNSFKLPKIEGGTVIFEEYSVIKKPVSSVVVNKITGQIIQIIKSRTTSLRRARREFAPSLKYARPAET